MSYTHICIACPDKHFIEPGTEKTRRPRHAGIGHEYDGSQVADGLRLDRDHKAVPLCLDTGIAQQGMLDRALSIIRERVPSAVLVDLETTDQSRYGFVLTGVSDADGNELLPDWRDAGHPLASLRDEVGNEINDLNWNGVVGEGYGGYATIDLRTETVVSSS